MPRCAWAVTCSSGGMGSSGRGIVVLDFCSLVRVRGGSRTPHLHLLCVSDASDSSGASFVSFVHVDGVDRVRPPLNARTVGADSTRLELAASLRLVVCTARFAILPAPCHIHLIAVAITLTPPIAFAHMAFWLGISTRHVSSSLVSPIGRCWSLYESPGTTVSLPGSLSAVVNSLRAPDCRASSCFFVSTRGGRVTWSAPGMSSPSVEMR